MQYTSAWVNVARRMKANSKCFFNEVEIFTFALLVVEFKWSSNSFGTVLLTFPQKPRISSYILYLVVSYCLTNSPLMIWFSNNYFTLKVHYLFTKQDWNWITTPHVFPLIFRKEIQNSVSFIFSLTLPSQNEGKTRVLAKRRVQFRIIESSLPHQHHVCRYPYL
jgi:hypothetical protein